ncbi:MAG: hypothetical protein WCC06_12120 [Candidatus Aminicenantales bacterium]
MICLAFIRSTVEGDAESLSRGNISVIPLQLSIRYKILLGEKIVPYIEGGLGFYLSRYVMDNEAAESWNAAGLERGEEVKDAVGFHVGTGLRYLLSGNLSLSVDVKYCLAGTKGSWARRNISSGSTASGEIMGLSLNSFWAGIGLELLF